MPQLTPCNRPFSEIFIGGGECKGAPLSGCKEWVYAATGFIQGP